MQMEYGIITAGFGGQGVLFTGRVLAEAAVLAGKQVTWYPSYGPEQRGGTCNCSVVIGDNPIGSPVIDRADYLIILNQPSWDKFVPTIKPNGVVISNSDLVKEKEILSREAVSVAVPASTLAAEAGDERVANMVLLGALLRIHSHLPVEYVRRSLTHLISSRHQHLLEIDRKCLELGYDYVEHWLD